MQECIQLTVKAAAAAILPSGCTRTIYLCDDGKDNEKQEYIRSLGAGYVYVSGRTRAKGEKNGKSGNLNNVFSQLYPADVEIPGNEVIVVFDADQVSTLQIHNHRKVVSCAHKAELCAHLGSACCQIAV